MMFIRRQYKFLAGGLVLGLLLLPLAWVVRPPAFTSMATIMIETNRIQLFPHAGMIGDSPIESSAALESQLEILNSSTVAKRVIDRLKLAEDPSFAVREQGRIARVFGTGIARMLGREPMRTEARRDRFRLDIFGSNLVVRRISGTFAVEVGYRSDSAEQSAHVANAIADVYLEVLLEMRQDLSRKAGSWLQSRVVELRQQLADAQRAVNEFKAQHKLLSTGGEQVTDRQLSDLNGQLAAAQAQERDAEAKLDRIRTAIADYKLQAIKPALPEQMNNALVTRLREQLFELSNREAEWLQRFGAHHEAVIKLQQRIEQLRRALLEEMNRLAESYRSELDIAQRRRAAVNRDLVVLVERIQQTDVDRIKLREFESNAKSVETLYDGFLRRHAEALEQENFPIPRARIVNPATEPLKRDGKRTYQIALLLFAFGAGLGAAAAGLREVVDRSFRTIGDVKQTLHRRVVGLVPSWDSTAAPVPAAERVPANSEQRIVSRLVPRVFAAKIAPHSPYAAAMRSISLQIDKLRTSSGSLVVGVMAPEPGQGASTVSLGLAAASSLAGMRTLLIECDLRNPSLTRALAPTAQSSLSDILEGHSTFNETVWTDRLTGFSFLPGKPDSPNAEADEVLASDRMRQLIDDLKHEFDYIILDLPPVVPMMDVLMTADIVNFYVTVIKWGKTRKEPTRLALEMHPAINEKLAGVVLNQVDLDQLRLYDPDAARWFDARLYSSYHISPLPRRPVGWA
jgi:succinoglycan biosynthesis transport protein ExoP